MNQPVPIHSEPSAAVMSSDACDTPGIDRRVGDLDPVVGTVHRLGWRRGRPERGLADVAELRGRRGGPELGERSFGPNVALDQLCAVRHLGHHGIGALRRRLKHRLSDWDGHLGLVGDREIRVVRRSGQRSVRHQNLLSA